MKEIITIKKGGVRIMIKKLVKPEEVETNEEKVIPFSESGCSGRSDRYYADEEIEDITF